MYKIESCSSKIDTRQLAYLDETNWLQVVQQHRNSLKYKPKSAGKIPQPPIGKMPRERKEMMHGTAPSRRAQHEFAGPARLPLHAAALGDGYYSTSGGAAITPVAYNADSYSYVPTLGASASIHTPWPVSHVNYLPPTVKNDNLMVKKPLNGFTVPVWPPRMRKTVADENLKMRRTDIEISKRLSKQWKALTNEDKIVYLDQANRLHVVDIKKKHNSKYKPKRKRRPHPIKMSSQKEMQETPHMIHHTTTLQDRETDRPHGPIMQTTTVVYDGQNTPNFDCIPKPNNYNNNGFYPAVSTTSDTSSHMRQDGSIPELLSDLCMSTGDCTLDGDSIQNIDTWSPPHYSYEETSLQDWDNSQFPFFLTPTLGSICSTLDSPVGTNGLDNPKAPATVPGLENGINFMYDFQDD